MNDNSPSRLNHWLAAAPSGVFAAYAMATAFGVYFCMYAFRKAYLAGSFTGTDLGVFGSPIALKTAFIVSQVVGYALSKYAGVSYCSGLPRHLWAWGLVGSILVAEGALVLFAVLPGQWKLLAMFLNGLPLGVIWGLVVRYLEGRQLSELLLAALSCAYVVSSGYVKQVGIQLMGLGVSEYWMPAATGACFLGPFVVLVWLLNQVPAPTAEDVAARTERPSMTAAQRWAFFVRFAPGLIILLLVYFFLTAYRDFRDNFQKELLAYFQLDGVATNFGLTEIWVGFGVMISFGLLFLIKNNRLGLLAVYAIMLVGMGLLVGANLLLAAGQISGFWWMVLTGLGAYLAYVPFGSVLFDRVIASTHFAGTAVFAIYLADAVGYTGSVGLVIYRDIFAGGVSRFEFFIGYTYFMAAVGAVGLATSAAYFWWQIPADQASTAADAEPGLALSLTRQPLPNQHTQEGDH